MFKIDKLYYYTLQCKNMSYINKLKQSLSGFGLLRQHKFLVIFLFAIVSGLPLALITSTFKIWLTEKGITITTIGFISLVTIPYSLKFIWSPAADLVRIPLLTARLGRRRSWIVATQAFLFLSIIAMLPKTSTILSGFKLPICAGLA